MIDGFILAALQAKERAQERCSADVYHAAHRDKLASRKRARNRALKLAVFNIYGGPVCVCCGETLIEGLNLDHINGDGGKERKHQGNDTYRWLKKNGYPPGYQVLCGTCNQAKRMGDHCPHQDIPGWRRAHP